MSLIELFLNQTYDKQKKHITENGKWFVSTNNTWDQGWETMVFVRNATSGEIEFGTPVDTEHYNDETEAYSGHGEMIKKWEVR